MDHGRHAGLPRNGEHRGEEALLCLARRVVAEPVETHLPRADRLRVAEERAHLRDVCLGRVAGGMRMDAEDRIDAIVCVRELERATAAGDVGADREDPRHPRFAGACDDLAGIVERVEMRVRVDHCSRRASSSSATSGGSLRKSGRGSASACPGGSSLGCHAPTQLS